MPDYGQDSPTPTIGTFASQAGKYRPQAPMPPQRNGLQDLMDFISESQAGYEKNGPVADLTRSVMPSLGALLGITMPMSQGKTMGDFRAAEMASGRPDPLVNGAPALMNQFINKVQGLANKPLTEGMGPLPGQGAGLNLYDLLKQPTGRIAPLPQNRYMNDANTRIDRINQANSRWDMPPIAYEGAGAPLSPASKGMPNRFLQGPPVDPAAKKQQVINDLLSGLNP